MNLWDRLLGKSEAVAAPIEFVKMPHHYCGNCGQPMVEGWMSTGRGFDRVTGAAVLHVLRNRMCMTLHRVERPEPEYEDEELKHNPLMDHDGYPYAGWSYYGNDPRADTVPDCEPRKAVPA